jgi:hypothetical protein
MDPPRSPHRRSGVLGSAIERPDRGFPVAERAPMDPQDHDRQQNQQLRVHDRREAAPVSRARTRWKGPPGAAFRRVAGPVLFSTRR